MNLDDLMEVWRSQDAAPLHGVNETLLRLALRQDEAKLQAQRRRERRIIYGMSGLFIAGMSIFFVMIFGMLFYNDDDVITGWDFDTPIVGAAAALFIRAADSPQMWARAASYRTRDGWPRSTTSRTRGWRSRKRSARCMGQPDDVPPKRGSTATIMPLGMFTRLNRGGTR